MKNDWKLYTASALRISHKRTQKNTFKNKQDKYDTENVINSIHLFWGSLIYYHITISYFATWILYRYTICCASKILNIHHGMFSSKTEKKYKPTKIIIIFFFHFKTFWELALNHIKIMLKTKYKVNKIRKISFINRI